MITARAVFRCHALSRFAVDPTPVGRGARSFPVGRLRIPRIKLVRGRTRIAIGDERERGNVGSKINDYAYKRANVHGKKTNGKHVKKKIKKYSTNIIIFFYDRKGDKQTRRTEISRDNYSSASRRVRIVRFYYTSIDVFDKQNE